MPYLGSAHPGAADPCPIERGANCQRYAYAVLGLFGVRLPALRSSELWADVAHTTRVHGRPKPLDLLLFNRSAEPYGAHVGIWLAEGQILHLCRAVGRPAVWAPRDFARVPRYRTLVGAKRPGPACNTGCPATPSSGNPRHSVAKPATCPDENRDTGW